MQSIRVRMNFTGIDDAQAAVLVDAFRTRCPIYTTLSRATPIDVATVLD
jgi:hypothetical protein